MPIQQTTTEKPAPAVVDSSLVLAGDERLRELAVEQIGRKRRFHMRAFAAAARNRSGARWTVCAARARTVEEVRQWLRM